MADLLNEKDQLISLEKLLKEKKFGDALELAKKVLKEFPGSFQVEFTYAKILRATGQLPEAEAILLKLMPGHKSHLTLLLEMGGLMTDQGKSGQAMDFYSQALFIDPFNKLAKEAMHRLKVVPEKQKMKADTLPEEDIGKLLDGEYIPDDEAGELPITADSIRMEDEVIPEIKPSIPGVDEAYVPPDAIKVKSRKKKTDPAVEESLMADPDFVATEENDDEEKVSTEDVADLFAESLNRPESDNASTRKASLSRETERGDLVTAGDEFVTESAGQLYLSQGLYEEALYIYEKLYQQKKEERYAEKIAELQGKCQCQKKIQALTAFLKLI
jgi:tetratricopeptide (TPR) repeat protein